VGRRYGMKLTVISVAVLSMIIFVAGALAVPPGKTIEWENPMGKITFDGKIHMDKGLKCNDCHTKIFTMKKGTAEMNMKQINEGKFCGACHDGTTAFKTSEPANCAKCHKK
jgi:c(7)-type cytochrome triheme protein